MKTKQFWWRHGTSTSKIIFLIIVAIFSINTLASWLHCKPEGEGAVWDGHTLDPHSLATPPDVDKILHLKTEMSNKKEKSFYLTETLVMLCGLLTSFCRLRTEPDPKTAILINSWQSFSFQHLLTWESDFGGDTKWSLTVLGLVSSKISSFSVIFCKARNIGCYCYPGK